MIDLDVLWILGSFVEGIRFDRKDVNLVGIRWALDGRLAHMKDSSAVMAF
jgi:hypothetical protein